MLIDRPVRPPSSMAAHLISRLSGHAKATAQPSIGSRGAAAAGIGSRGATAAATWCGGGKHLRPLSGNCCHEHIDLHHLLECGRDVKHDDHTELVGAPGGGVGSTIMDPLLPIEWPDAAAPWFRRRHDQ
jgi:hypothetical protein